MADELTRRDAVGPEEVARWGRNVARAVIPPPGPAMSSLPGPGRPPTVTHPSAGRRKRTWWMIAATVVAVLALAGGLLVAFGPAWTSGLPGRPATVLAPPIGDSRTADPCGLLNMGSVQQRFGPATMVRDIGYPQSCLIIIGPSRLTATFGAAEDEAPAGVAERIGDVTIIRDEWHSGGLSGASCRRTVLLSDQSRVYVTAEAYSLLPKDLCAVADAGTQIAVSALSSPTLPRRDVTDPPNALTWVDTCSLLDQAALKRVPGLDTSRRRQGFAGWLCSWGDMPQVSVSVSRLRPLSGELVQIAGRSAQVTPGGFRVESGACVVQLVQRSYLEASGNPRDEVLQLAVFLGGYKPAESACLSATALAEAAAPKLPPA